MEVFTKKSMQSKDFHLGSQHSFILFHLLCTILRNRLLFIVFETVQSFHGSRVLAVCSRITNYVLKKVETAETPDTTVVLLD